MISNFPIQVLLPKSETQVDLFLKKYPNFDGRGIVLAVFDTGVDPGANGLHLTSDGKIKIVDMVDCTGSGDVSVEQSVELDENGVLQSPFTKRRFHVGSQWKNANNNRYNIGMKRAYELFPDPLRNRIKEERKKEFERKHLQAIAEIKKRMDMNNKDLELQIKQLEEMYKNYDDPGPIYDCICFFDGEHWRACIYPDDQIMDSIDQIIELDGYSVLTDYSIEHQYATFSNADKMNYSVNFYNDGKILSIVTCAGSHGTHVAGILSAYHENEPELNGVAPGCQIVSVKIGNSYLGTMETNTGICRGIIATRLNNCHLVNMSYGEASSMPDRGRFAKLVSELVNEHNVVFVASAGNSGPALSTFGSPAENSDIIGVGAYVSSDMMAVQYSLREKLPEIQYTWSSRGPSLDGWTISISGPGAAITCVPEYQLQKAQRMNGTSMASPSVCGGIACLLSALMQSGKQWNPSYIRRAIQCTARQVANADPLGLGSGILQIYDAFEWMKANEYNPRENLRYLITLPHEGNARGIYLREYQQSARPSDHTIQVETKFAENAPNIDKVEYQKHIQLKCNQSWVQVPSFYNSVNEKNSFSVRVDPTYLPENQVHYGEVLALDAANINSGPLFKVPITVIKPTKLRENISVYNLGRMSFKPGTIIRHFVTVPNGAEFAQINLSTIQADTSRTFLLHCLQLQSKTAFTVFEFKKYISTSQDNKKVHYIKTIPGATLEICLAQFWSSLGFSELECNIEFHGVKTYPSHLHMQLGDPCAKLVLNAQLKTEELKLKCNFDTWTRHLRPNSSQITALTDDRNRLLNGDVVYNMILTYSFKMAEAGKVCCRVPIISSMLYESSFEAQLIMIFNGNKKLIKVCDAWPKKVQLPKGEIVVRLSLRHEILNRLESLKNIILNVDQTLSKEIAVTAYGDANEAIHRNGDKVEKFSLALGNSTAIFISAPEESALPKEAQHGDILFGKVQLFEKSTHGSVPFTYSVPPRVKKEDERATENKELEKLDKRTPEKKYEEYIIQESVKYIQKQIKKTEDYEPLINELIEKYPENLAIFSLFLQYLTDESNKKRLEQIDLAIEIANRIISMIDVAKLAIHFGTSPKNKDSVKEDYEWIKLDREYQKQRRYLVDALYRKALIAEYSAESNKVSLEETVKELEKWVDDSSDFKYLNVYVSVLMRKKKYGKVLEVIRKALSESKASDTEEEKKLFTKWLQTVKELGWNHWIQYLERLQLVEYPPSYPLQQ